MHPGHDNQADLQTFWFCNWRRFCAQQVQAILQDWNHTRLLIALCPAPARGAPITQMGATARTVGRCSCPCAHTLVMLRSAARAFRRGVLTCSSETLGRHSSIAAHARPCCHTLNTEQVRKTRRGGSYSACSTRLMQPGHIQIRADQGKPSRFGSHGEPHLLGSSPAIAGSVFRESR
jgi:hypothetical protein